MPETISFESIPNEIILLILFYLTDRELIFFSGINKRMSFLASQEKKNREFSNAQLVRNFQDPTWKIENLDDGNKTLHQLQKNYRFIIKNTDTPDVNIGTLLTETENLLPTEIKALVSRLMNEKQTSINPYHFDEVNKTLNNLAPQDWTSLLTFDMATLLNLEQTIKIQKNYEERNSTENYFKSRYYYLISFLKSKTSLQAFANTLKMSLKSLHLSSADSFYSKNADLASKNYLTHSNLARIFKTITVETEKEKVTEFLTSFLSKWLIEFKNEFTPHVSAEKQGHVLALEEKSMGLINYVISNKLYANPLLEHIKINYFETLLLLPFDKLLDEKINQDNLDEIFKVLSQLNLPQNMYLKKDYSIPSLNTLIALTKLNVAMSEAYMTVVNENINPYLLGYEDSLLKKIQKIFTTLYAKQPGITSLRAEFYHSILSVPISAEMMSIFLNTLKTSIKKSNSQDLKTFLENLLKTPHSLAVIIQHFSPLKDFFAQPEKLFSSPQLNKNHDTYYWKILSLHPALTTHILTKAKTIDGIIAYITNNDFKRLFDQMNPLLFPYLSQSFYKLDLLFSVFSIDELIDNHENTNAQIIRLIDNKNLTTQEQAVKYRRLLDETPPSEKYLFYEKLNHLNFAATRKNAFDNLFRIFLHDNTVFDALLTLEEEPKKNCLLLFLSEQSNHQANYKDFIAILCRYSIEYRNSDSLFGNLFPMYSELAIEAFDQFVKTMESCYIDIFLNYFKNADHKLDIPSAIKCSQLSFIKLFRYSEVNEIFTYLGHPPQACINSEEEKALDIFSGLFADNKRPNIYSWLPRTSNGSLIDILTYIAPDKKLDLQKTSKLVKICDVPKNNFQPRLNFTLQQLIELSELEHNGINLLKLITEQQEHFAGIPFNFIKDNYKKTIENYQKKRKREEEQQQKMKEEFESYRKKFKSTTPGVSTLFVRIGKESLLDLVKKGKEADSLEKKNEVFSEIEALVNRKWDDPMEITPSQTSPSGQSNDQSTTASTPVALPKFQMQ